MRNLYACVGGASGFWVAGRKGFGVQIFLNDKEFLLYSLGRSFCISGCSWGHQLCALSSYTLRTRRSWVDKTGGGVLVASVVSTCTLWVLGLLLHIFGSPFNPTTSTGECGSLAGGHDFSCEMAWIPITGKMEWTDMAAYRFVFWGLVGQWRNLFQTHTSQKIALVSGFSLI